jgi:CheY-like chemotaxis protein
MKINALIIDDDLQTCQVIQAILTSAGMDARFLTDSAAAAARLHTEKVDLLFLDLHMPTPGGFDLLRSLRCGGVNRHTPVVLITGDQDPRVLTRGFQAGANYFLFKPIELNRLMRVVRASEGAVYREKRRFQRVSVTRRATVVNRGHRVNGSTLDVSLGGMMFRGESTLEAGAQVEVELDIGTRGRPLHLACRVARVLEDGCAGLEFLRMSGADSERLQQFLLPMILEPAAAAAEQPARKGTA